MTATARKYRRRRRPKRLAPPVELPSVDAAERARLCELYGKAECQACGEFERAEDVEAGRCAWCRENGKQIETEAMG